MDPIFQITKNKNGKYDYADLLTGVRRQNTSKQTILRCLSRTLFPEQRKAHPTKNTYIYREPMPTNSVFLQNFQQTNWREYTGVERIFHALVRKKMVWWNMNKTNKEVFRKNPLNGEEYIFTTTTLTDDEQTWKYLHWIPQVKAYRAMMGSTAAQTQTQTQAPTATAAMTVQALQLQVAQLQQQLSSQQGNGVITQELNAPPASPAKQPVKQPAKPKEQNWRALIKICIQPKKGFFSGYVFAEAKGTTKESMVCRRWETNANDSTDWLEAKEEIGQLIYGQVRLTDDDDDRQNLDTISGLVSGRVVTCWRFEPSVPSVVDFTGDKRLFREGEYNIYYLENDTYDKHTNHFEGVSKFEWHGNKVPRYESDTSDEDY